MSISGISGQASSIQVNILLGQGRANGAGESRHARNDGDGDDGGASIGNNSASAASAQGASPFANLAQQIQSAVDGAVNSLDPSSSNNPLDVIKTILEALDKALKDNAQGGSGSTAPSQTASDATSTVDPTQQIGTTTASNGSTSASQGSADSTITSPVPGDGTVPTGQQSLLDSLLNQFGIDPQQFKTDLLSALGGSQNGNVDFSIVFKNFPVGQSINTQA
jgi:hypothetical protein